MSHMGGPKGEGLPFSDRPLCGQTGATLSPSTLTPAGRNSGTLYCSSCPLSLTASSLPTGGRRLQGWKLSEKPPGECEYKEGRAETAPKGKARVSSRRGVVPLANPLEGGLAVALEKEAHEVSC